MSREKSSTPRKKRANGTGTMFYDKKRKFWLVRFSCWQGDKMKKRSKSFRDREQAEEYLIGMSAQRRRNLAMKNIHPSSGAGTITENRVYFVQPLGGGPIKIGTTNDVRRRLSHLQYSSPYPLNLLYSCPGDYKTEREFHRRFEKHRLHGEWFEENEEIMNFIEKLKRETSAF